MPSRKAPKKTGSYPAHRERQRRRILDAAAKLFDERGIDRTTMAELTAASGVQPSTLYQYFSSKDDIVWALLDAHIHHTGDLAQAALRDQPNALARITALFEVLAVELESNSAGVRFLAQFDALYARDWPVERLLSLESRIHPNPLNAFTAMVREGIADGSLRSDLNPSLTMHAVINAVIAAQRRLASLGTKVEQEYGQPIHRLFRETIRILLQGLRNPEPTKPKSRKKQSSAPARSRKRNTR